MLKLSVTEVIDKATSQVQEQTAKIKSIEQSRDYSPEYKNSEIKKLNQQIEFINRETIENIQKIAEDEIKALNASANPNSDMTTSNILKMLDITKETITPEHLQEILNNNVNDPLVYAAASSIAQQFNVNIIWPENKANKIDKINELTTNLVQKINLYGIDSVGTQVSLHYLPE